MSLHETTFKFIAMAGVLLTLGASAEASPQSKPRVKAAAAPVLARHLDMAIDIDAQSTALVAQRAAVGARYYTSNSITPGSPYFAGSHRKNAGGNLREYRETEFEVGVPIWLPGQSAAYEGTVTTGLVEVEERLLLRRLDVAALVRDAWWNAQRAARFVSIARNRVSTARDIESDMRRRAELGETGQQDVLLAQNERLAAEVEVAEAEAAVKASRAAYAVLTGGASPDGFLEPPAPPLPLEDHPALRTPLASLARAESQIRLVDATFIDNPEIGVFGRQEHNRQYSTDPSQQVTDQLTDSTTVGLRFKIPLPTPGRNVPRRAEAEAELVRAQAEYERANRVISAEITASRVALAAARRAEGLAAKRLAVANDQLELTRKAFQLGEMTAVDLFRVRQSQLDAQRAHASATTNVGAAQSRVNQALGYAPEG